MQQLHISFKDLPVCEGINSRQRRTSKECSDLGGQREHRHHHPPRLSCLPRRCLWWTQCCQPWWTFISLANNFGSDNWPSFVSPQVMWKATIFSGRRLTTSVRPQSTCSPSSSLTSSPPSSLAWWPSSSAGSTWSRCFVCRSFTWGAAHLFQVWLHVIKEFGLVFAIHQTYLLDYQFCIVESKWRSYLVFSS